VTTPPPPQPPQPPPAPPAPPATWGPVVITPREVYDAVIGVGQDVRALQQQLGNHTDEHDHRDTVVDARLADHENRIRARERAAWPLPSLAVLIALGSLIAAVLIHH